MNTRTINIQLIEQTQKRRIVTFTPKRLTAADDDVLLRQVYVVRVDADGAATIDLPVRESGTITYQYEIPAVNGKSKGEFNLEAGSPIDLADLIEGSPVASDTIQQYIDGKIAEVKPYLEYSALMNQSGTDAPTATVLTNTIGDGLSWGYGDVGNYYIEGMGSLTGKRVVVIPGANSSYIGTSETYEVDILGGVAFYVNQLNGGSYQPVDGLWADQYIEIRVYDV